MWYCGRFLASNSWDSLSAPPSWVTASTKRWWSCWVHLRRGLDKTNPCSATSLGISCNPMRRFKRRTLRNLVDQISEWVAYLFLNIYRYWWVCSSSVWALYPSLIWMDDGGLCWRIYAWALIYLFLSPSHLSLIVKSFIPFLWLERKRIFHVVKRGKENSSDLVLKRREKKDGLWISFSCWSTSSLGSLLDSLLPSLHIPTIFNNNESSTTFSHST